MSCGKGLTGFDAVKSGWKTRFLHPVCMKTTNWITVWVARHFLYFPQLPKWALTALPEPKTWPQKGHG
jgi:hypothetical protein